MEVLACMMFPCTPKVICGTEGFMVVVIVDVVTGWEVVGLEVFVEMVDVVAVEVVEVVDTMSVDVDVWVFDVVGMVLEVDGCDEVMLWGGWAPILRR